MCTLISEAKKIFFIIWCKINFPTLLENAVSVGDNETFSILAQVLNEDEETRQERITVDNLLKLAENSVKATDFSTLKVLIESIPLDQTNKVKLLTQLFADYCDKIKHKIITKQLTFIEELLDLGAAVNGEDDFSSLNYAILLEDSRFLTLLLHKGADPNKEDWSSPLFRAVETGKVDLVNLLLEHGAHPLKAKKCPLFKAFALGFFECAESLLKYGAKFCFKTIFDQIIENKNTKGLEFLVSYCYEEAANYIKNQKTEIFLQTAVRHTNVAIVKMLVSLGCCTGDLTRLLAEANAVEMVTYLIEKGAQLNKKITTRKTSHTPLYNFLLRQDICHTTQYEIIKTLLVHSASPNIDKEITPLMRASMTSHNNTKILDLLITHGANINARTSTGETALMFCIGGSCQSNVDFLLKRGADTTIQTKVGFTPLLQTAVFGNKDILHRILETQPNLNITDNLGNTPLLYLIDRIGDPTNRPIIIEMVSMLIQAGCDINLPNRDGLTALMFASNKRSTSLLQLLLNTGAAVNQVNTVSGNQTALSYYKPTCIKGDSYRGLLSFFDSGACLSYLSPALLYKIITCSYPELIQKFVKSGTGPISIKASIYKTYNYASLDVKSDFEVSPLCIALLAGNVKLATYFIDNLFILPSDITELPSNEVVLTSLKQSELEESLLVLQSLATQPMSLFNLSFVVVSASVGTKTGRKPRVMKLNIPNILKDTLLYKEAGNVSLTSILPLRLRFADSDDDDDFWFAVDCIKLYSRCRCYSRLSLTNRRTVPHKYLCSENLDSD